MRTRKFYTVVRSAQGVGSFEHIQPIFMVGPNPRYRIACSLQDACSQQWDDTTVANGTRNLAVAEGPRDALLSWNLVSCWTPVQEIELENAGSSCTLLRVLEIALSDRPLYHLHYYWFVVTASLSCTIFDMLVLSLLSVYNHLWDYTFVQWRTNQQGVALRLTGRNTTGPPRAAPGELRCICAALQTTDDADRRRQTPTTITSLPPTLCVGGPVIKERKEKEEPTVARWVFTHGCQFQIKFCLRSCLSNRSIQYHFSQNRLCVFGDVGGSNASISHCVGIIVLHNSLYRRGSRDSIRQTVTPKRWLADNILTDLSHQWVTAMKNPTAKSMRVVAMIVVRIMKKTSRMWPVSITVSSTFRNAVTWPIFILVASDMMALRSLLQFVCC